MSLLFRRMIAVFAACGLLLATAACRENEQGRILVYEKGTYLGPKDTPRSEAQNEELQRRVHQQRAP